MKRKLIFLAIMAGMAISSSAELVYEEFYGTKKSGSYVNPCKGNTTRTCARRWRYIMDLQSLQSGVQVKETICDENGKKITSSTYQVMNATPASMIADMERMLPANAVMYILPESDMPDFDE